MVVDWKSWPDLVDVLQRLPGPDGPSEVVRRADSYWKSCPKPRRDTLRVTQIDYPFSSPLIIGGEPLGPDGKPLPPELLVSPRLPCGMIVDGYCEVGEAVLASEVPIYTPQALLGPGEWIGLFELLDQVVPAQGPKYPDWTISAGARTFYCLQNPAKKTAYTRIRNHHLRSSPPWDRVEFENRDTHYLLEIIKPVREQARKWTASVVYFSPQWFSELSKTEIRQSRRSPALAFFRLLLEAGWRAEARIRESDSVLYDALVAFGGQHPVKFYDAAYQIVEKCRQVLEGRRPCFIPVDRSDDFGPWQAIIDGIVVPAGFAPEIMVPRYLQPGEVGYLPLAHIIPDLFEEHAIERMQEVIDVIRTARTVAKVKNHRVVNLEIAELFRNISLRIKTGGDSTVKAFDLPLEDERELRPIRVEDFYKDRFPDVARQPKPGSEFFRVAIRIKRPN
jgi:hypothetical protein